MEARGRTERITWVGHSSALLEAPGFTIVTDPLLVKRVAHLRRRTDLPGRIAADADLVLISHAHMDHLHVPSLKLIRPDAHVVTPAGTARLVRRAGFRNVTEVRPGDRVVSGPATVDVVPAVHKAGRGPHSRISGPPVGFVVDVGGHRTYYAGDTDLFDEMGDIDDIDVALLPIWGWGATIGIGHLDPRRAVEATKLVRPDVVVPVHWGTYSPEDGRRGAPKWFDAPIEDFVAAMREGGESDRLEVLRPGGVVEIG